MYRHLLDHTVGRSGTDVDVTLLAAKIQWCIELAVKVSKRAPQDLRDATFRAVLGHLLFRIRQDG